MKFRNEISVRHFFGKGEALGSIPSGSTTKRPPNRHFCVEDFWDIRHLDTQRSTNTTSKYGGNPWGLFAVRPDAERSLILDKPNPIDSIESRQSFSLAALYVERDGVYFGLPHVDPWDEQRDARLYTGPYPVIAHPPCERWCRFWHGSTRKPHQYRLGDDGGRFAAALAAVRRWGGVLEHPEASHAWRAFGLIAPPRCGGWVVADFEGGWTCCVEQGHYGHLARKATWLYAHGIELPSLRWGEGAQRLHPVALAKHGYEKARRIGMMAMVGGKNKKRIRDATPIEFRDLLISMVAVIAGGETQ